MNNNKSETETKKAISYIRVSSEKEKFCFSYNIRFSSEGQRGGSSVERQAEIAPEVAEDKGWTFREDWNYENLGVSASKGLNIETIREIISKVPKVIPAGSVMIIEALDRLTRLDLEKALPFTYGNSPERS